MSEGVSTDQPAAGQPRLGSTAMHAAIWAVLALAGFAALLAAFIGVQHVWGVAAGPGGTPVSFGADLPHAVRNGYDVDGVSISVGASAEFDARQTPWASELLTTATLLRYLTFIVGAGVVIIVCLQLLRSRPVASAVRGGLFVLGSFCILTGVLATNLELLAGRLVFDEVNAELPRGVARTGLFAAYPSVNDIDWTLVGSGVLQVLLACCFIIAARTQRAAQHELEGLI